MVSHFFSDAVSVVVVVVVCAVVVVSCAVVDFDINVDDTYCYHNHTVVVIIVGMCAATYCPRYTVLLLFVLLPLTLLLITHISWACASLRLLGLFILLFSYINML